MMRSSPVTATLLNIGAECAVMRRNRCTKEGLGTPAQNMNDTRSAHPGRLTAWRTAEEAVTKSSKSNQSEAAMRYVCFRNQERSAPSK